MYPSALQRLILSQGRRRVSSFSNVKYLSSCLLDHSKPTAAFIPRKIIKSPASSFSSLFSSSSSVRNRAYTTSKFNVSCQFYYCASPWSWGLGHQLLARKQEQGQGQKLRGMATSAFVPDTEGMLEEEKKSWHPPRPRKFVPLNPDRAEEVKGEKLPKLRGIIFDVDGTLCLGPKEIAADFLSLPQNYMFKEMRDALGIEKPTDILDHIKSLSTEIDQESPQPSSPQSRAQEAIRQIERNAMTSQRAQPGLVELMTYLEKRAIPKALCTRNFPAPVDHLIDTFLSELKDGFDMIVTRETEGIAPKPSPEGLWAIARNWSLDKDDQSGVYRDEKSQQEDALVRARRQLGSGLIMVGDSIDDMAAGYRAGAATVLLVNDENGSLAEHRYVDRPIMRLDELTDILDNGFQGTN